MSRARGILLAMMRRRSVQIGVLLLVVGIPEIVIGHSKAGEYRARLERLAPPPATAPTELYPKVRADDERRAVYLGKIGYYELVGSAGRVLVLLGLGGIALGLVRQGTSTVSIAHSR